MSVTPFERNERQSFGIPFCSTFLHPLTFTGYAGRRQQFTAFPAFSLDDLQEPFGGRSGKIIVSVYSCPELRYHGYYFFLVLGTYI